MCQIKLNAFKVIPVDKPQRQILGLQQAKYWFKTCNLIRAP